MIVLKYGLFYDQEKETWITIEPTQFDEQANEPNLWAVRRNSGAMSNKTGEFSYEPFPSNRTEEFFKEFRFSTVEEAKNTWEKFHMKNYKIKIPDSIPIQTDKEVLMWVCQQELRSYEKKEKALLANNVTELTLAFGPHHITHNGEYKSKVWILPFENEKFNVFSAKGLGTAYEIIDKTNEEIRTGKYTDLIKRFLEYISHNINQTNKQ